MKNCSTNGIVIELLGTEEDNILFKIIFKFLVRLNRLGIEKIRLIDKPKSQ